MASEPAVLKMMRIFSRNFAGEITKEKCRLYEAALRDVDDEQLTAATARVVKEYEGEFVPPVAIIRKYANANARPALDVDGVLAQIGRLGTSGPPSWRWYPPRPETVAKHLPAAVARAYAEVGGTALFSENPTTREIAVRDFGRTFRDLVRDAPGLALPVLAAAAPAAGFLSPGPATDGAPEAGDEGPVPEAEGDPTARL